MGDYSLGEEVCHTRRLSEVLEAIGTCDEAHVVTTSQPPFRIVAFNPAWTKLCGFSDEALGQTCKILQGLQTDSNALCNLHETLREGVKARVQLVNYTKAGQPFRNELTVEPLVDEQERLTHCLGTLRPILNSLDTPPKYLESEDSAPWVDFLRDFPSTVEDALSLNYPIVVTESARPFRITHVNEAWCRTCNFSVEEAVGNTCAILQGPDTCRETLHSLSLAADEHLQITVRLLNFTKEGFPFMNTLCVAPLADASGIAHRVAVLQPQWLDQKQTSSTDSDDNSDTYQSVAVHKSSHALPVVSDGLSEIFPGLEPLSLDGSPPANQPFQEKRKTPEPSRPPANQPFQEKKKTLEPSPIADRLSLIWPDSPVPPPGGFSWQRAVRARLSPSVPFKQDFASNPSPQNLLEHEQMLLGMLQDGSPPRSCHVSQEVQPPLDHPSIKYDQHRQQQPHHQHQPEAVHQYHQQQHPPLASPHLMTHQREEMQGAPQAQQITDQQMVQQMQLQQMQQHELRLLRDVLQQRLVSTNSLLPQDIARNNMGANPLGEHPSAMLQVLVLKIGREVDEVADVIEHTHATFYRNLTEQKSRLDACWASMLTRMPWLATLLQQLRTEPCGPHVVAQPVGGSNEDGRCSMNLGYEACRAGMLLSSSG